LLLGPVIVVVVIFVVGTFCKPLKIVKSTVFAKERERERENEREERERERERQRQRERDRRPCGVVGDRLPVVVRFPAGPQVSLKCGDQSKDNGAGHKKKPEGEGEAEGEEEGEGKAAVPFWGALDTTVQHLWQTKATTFLFYAAVCCWS